MEEYSTQLAITKVSIILYLTLCFISTFRKWAINNLKYKKLYMNKFKLISQIIVNVDCFNFKNNSFVADYL